MIRLAGRSLLAIFVILAAVGLLAACSSGEEQESNTPTGNTPTATATKTSTPSPTPTQESSSQLLDACSAFSFVSGLSGAAGAALPGGVSVTGSPSATSSIASSVGAFFEGVMSDAFGGSSKAGCFYEAQADDGYALWVAFSIPEPVPSDAVSKLSTALSAEGVNVVGSFSGQSDGSAFSWMIVEQLPLDKVEGGLLYILGSEVVVVTGFGEEGPEPTTTGSDANSTPTPTSSAQQPPTGDLVGEFDGVLQPKLESALGVGLTLLSNIQTTSGRETMVQLVYTFDGTLPGGTNVPSALGSVVTGLGGTVTANISTAGLNSLSFDGLRGGVHIATGNILCDGASQVSVTLQVS